MDTPQLGQLLFRGALGGELGGHALQTAGDLEQLDDLARGHPCHPRPPVRQQLDQALGGENLQGLAQRRARDFEEVAQRLLVDPLAGRKLVLDDHVAQPFGHVVMQRATTNGARRPFRAREP